MLYISFSQEKYRVGISLLLSENPLRFLRIAVDMRILFSCRYYLLILLHHFLDINLLSIVSYGNILKSDNHHFIKHMASNLPNSQPEDWNYIYSDFRLWTTFLYREKRGFNGSFACIFSNLPGQFSDAEIDLLITNFLLLFVACCSRGFCKISRVSGYQVARVR